MVWHFKRDNGKHVGEKTINLMRGKRRDIVDIQSFLIIQDLEFM